jgi:DNA-binding SARP family transcriptional activator
MALVRLALLGGFQARAADGAEGAPPPAPTRKAEALLAYLALQRGTPVRRDALAKLLWGRHAAAHARNSLRQALTALRRALGDAAGALADAERDAVALDPAAVEVDALEFERLAASANPADLHRAMELYRGELLAGFDALPAPGFAEWRAREAARLRGIAVAALLRLLAHEEAVAPDGAEAVARRLLELDPAQEPAHRALMRRYAAMGQPVLAQQQYEACRELLQSRLGTAPSPETEALREALLVGRSAPAATLPFGGSLADATSRSDPLPLATEPAPAALFPARLSDSKQEFSTAGAVTDVGA